MIGTTIAVLLVLLMFIMVAHKPYKVVVAQDDFTGFSGSKVFGTYKEAKAFALSNKDFFDFVWIEHHNKEEIITEKKSRGWE